MARKNAAKSGLSEEMQGIIRAAGSASVAHKPGAVRLDGYPLLTYAPKQWGEGVRTEDKGIPVLAVVSKFAELGSIDAAAEALGTTIDHVQACIDYARAVENYRDPENGESDHA